ncbi:MAG: nucleotidyltransferase family protein [Phycisphaeraceae bacterium]|nr:nucleotidyltransferase family protein [Phycisphaeraceae bacterium]MBX3408042.1 nucleotidyltransferase family protein [Phycisphaeraceae bacterium]
MAAPVPKTVPLTDGGAILKRMVDAVEKVRQRLLRATAALKSAGIDYAVVGGNAVAAWVKTVDPGGIRTTLDVDVLVRRSDFEAARAALEAAGFVYRHAASLDMFLDDPAASPREAVHILFAREKVRDDQPEPNPDVSESVEMDSVRFATLDALVRNKLSTYRLKDRMHLIDLIQIGLVDQSWTQRFSPTMGERLQSLLDSPDQ